jgi:exonuclease III
MYSGIKIERISMDFPTETIRDERCPADTPYLCGKSTPGRGLCVADPADCYIRTQERRAIPMIPTKNTDRGAAYGYVHEHLGRGSPGIVRVDYEATFPNPQNVPANFSLLTYNIWGLPKERLKKLFGLRKPLLTKTLMESGADMFCLQEMSEFSFKELWPDVISKMPFVSENPYPATGHDRNRLVDTFFMSKWRPKWLCVYAMPGVLGYTNTLLLVEYPNLVIFNLYMQSGSRSSPGQEHKWIHYSRSRADILATVHDMIRDRFASKPVIVCGDFNFHLDGTLDDWPELEGIHNLIGFKDTFRSLNPNDPGYTEDTDINHMRWNQKLMEKKYRYDAILFRQGRSAWTPSASRLVGLETQQLDAEDSEWFLEFISEARENGRSSELHLEDGLIPINASDHFGVLTRFYSPNHHRATHSNRARSKRRRTQRKIQTA